MNVYSLLLLASFIFVFSFYSVSGQLGYNNPNLPQIQPRTVLTSSSNNNTFNVNASNCWQSYCDPSIYAPFWYNQTIPALANDYWNVSGTNLFPQSLGYDVGIGTSSPTKRLDIIGGNADQFRISNTESDLTLKNAYIQGRHYNNSEQDVLFALGSSNNGVSDLWLGGGSSVLNAVERMIFYTAGDDITLTGIERMRLDNDGDLGINITNPSSPLHVGGNDGSTPIARFANSVNSNIYQAFYSNAEHSYIEINTNNSLRNAEIGFEHSNSGNYWRIGAGATDFFIGQGSAGNGLMSLSNTILSIANVTQHFTYNGFGNVGIKTISPATVLHVNGTTTIINNNLSSSNLHLRTPRMGVTGNDIVGGIDFISDDTSVAEQTVAYIRGEAVATHSSVELPTRLTFGVTQSGLRNATDTMILSNARQLKLIGTNYLGGALTSADSGLLIEGNGSGNGIFTPSISFKNNGGLANAGRAAIAGIQGTTDQDQLGLAFFVHSGATGGDALIEAMRINYLGNIGIGTIVPNTKLDVSGNNNGNITLFRLENANTTYSQTVDFKLDTNKDLIITGGSSAGGIIFDMGTRGYSFLDGKVGINTTTPQKLLDVRGDINATNITSLHQTYNITASTALDTTYTNSLDRPIYIDITMISSVTALGDAAQTTLYTGGNYISSEGILSAIDTGGGEVGEYHHHGGYIQPNQLWSINSTVVGGGSVSLDRVYITVI